MNETEGGGLRPPTLQWDAECETLIYNYTDLTQIPAVRYLFTIAYTVISLIAFLGNLLVIVTIARSRHMRTVTNYYLLNLAVSDLLVSLLVTPLKLLEYMAPCGWGVFHTDVLCSALYFLLPVFVFTSVLTLCAISLERLESLINLNLTDTKSMVIYFVISYPLF